MSAESNTHEMRTRTIIDGMISRRGRNSTAASPPKKNNDARTLRGCQKNLAARPTPIVKDTPAAASSTIPI